MEENSSETTEEHSNIVSVVGEEGVGKTTLSLYYLTHPQLWFKRQRRLFSFKREPSDLWFSANISLSPLYSYLPDRQLHLIDSKLNHYKNTEDERPKTKEEQIERK